MNIEGKKIVVQKTTKQVYDFFIKLENFERLMPQDTQKFQVSENSFLFGLKGMPEIKLVMKEKIPFSKVVLSSGNDEKISFTLTSKITQISEHKSEIQLFFNGDFNPVMAMMIKKPLSKFIETLTKNIANL